ncbi:MAG: hypothetical protein IT440_04720 [Phycisphaeraceae bacterium]|nr:hypothetical protein [Phycisphaeraceae bacterium]
MRRLTVLASTVTLALLGLGLQAHAGPDNLLTNPGFEDHAGWLTGWVVEPVNPKVPLYHYRLHPGGGGGHGDALPHTGDNALEIYSANTRLRQNVKLDAGDYLLTVWARNNGCTISPRIQLALGDQKHLACVISDRYRLYYAVFKVQAAGEYPVSLISIELGLAVDDISLTRYNADDPLPGQYLHLDLHPAGGERSNNIQTYIRGMKQWLDFTLTAQDASRVGRPVFAITVPAEVLLTGINVPLLNSQKPDGVDKIELATQQSQGADGEKLTTYRFVGPRFFDGADNPMEFGGCFVEVPTGVESWVRFSVSDRDAVVTEETFRLVPLDAPARQKTPTLTKTFAYHVQSWRADFDGRLATIPAQFKLMGFNVWSEYFGPGPRKTAPVHADEQVMAKAAVAYGIREFWPNFSQLLGGADAKGVYYWDTAPREKDDPDMYVVHADGSVDKDMFNMRYAAGRGRYWVDAALNGMQRLIRRPAELGLPFQYNGFVNDGLEGMVLSYDPTTLADFAQRMKLDPAKVTVESLGSTYAKQWTSYNNALFAQVLANLAEALREAKPGCIVINTAGAFGSQHGVDDLPLAEQMTWGKTYDYNMPQWYGLNFFGSFYGDFITQGADAKVYGKHNGYPDMIPLLLVSMGSQMQKPVSARFMSIDMLSISPVVKGIGFYIATNGFADARWMVGLSQVNTLIADIEDYYQHGTRRDNLVKFAKSAQARPIETRDDEGFQKVMAPEVRTVCRVHVLNQPHRQALITVVSHCNQGVGEPGDLTLDLSGLGAKPGMFLYDHLAGKKLPLTPKLGIDTRNTGNLAVLEITDRLPDSE